MQPVTAQPVSGRQSFVAMENIEQGLWRKAVKRSPLMVQRAAERTAATTIEEEARRTTTTRKRTLYIACHRNKSHRWAVSEAQEPIIVVVGIRSHPLLWRV